MNNKKKRCHFQLHTLPGIQGASLVCHLHADAEIRSVVVRPQELDIEDGVSVIGLLSVEHVHLHLVVVTFGRLQDRVSKNESKLNTENTTAYSCKNTIT